MDTLKTPQTDYFFIADRNAEEVDVRVQLINAYNLPDEYLPDERSYFGLGLPDFYHDYFHEFSYLEKLREHGYAFKLEPTDRVHGTTVSTKEGGLFLIGITKSIDSYLDNTATEKFKGSIGDRSKLNRKVNQVKARTSPRIADANFASFEVIIAIDTAGLISNDKEVTEWRDEVIQGYQNDVLDVDFTNEADAETIVERFPDPETRKKIFDPIFKILENTDVALSVSTHNKSFHRSYRGKKANENFKKKVLPQVTLEELLEEQQQRTKIVTAVFKLPEGGAISDFKKKELIENLLFTQEGGQTIYPIPSPIEQGEISIQLHTPLECVLNADPNGRIILYNTALGLHAESDTMPEAIEEIKRQFITLVLEHNKRPEYIDETVQALLPMLVM